jgi:hypothetical protein
MKKSFIFNKYLNIYTLKILTISNIYYNNLVIKNIHTNVEPAILINKLDKNKKDKDLSFNQ